MRNDRIKLRQVAMFQAAARRGITRKMVAIDGEFPARTVDAWADGTHEMPLHAVEHCAGSGALPVDILSLLFADGLELVRAGEGGVDHHALAASAADFAGALAGATHPASEAGTAIGPGENERLNAGARALRSVSGA